MFKDLIPFLSDLPFKIDTLFQTSLASRDVIVYAMLHAYDPVFIHTSWGHSTIKIEQFYCKLSKLTFQNTKIGRQ